MKQLFIAIVLVLQIISTYANTITLSTNNGDWKNNNTWSPATLPQSGDTVIIPAGKSVIVKNEVYTNAPNIYIKDWGTISFMPSGKLSLGANAVVEVFTGGKIETSGTNSERIYIADVLKYQGKTDGNIIGYALASLSSGVSGIAVASGFLTGTLEIKLKEFKTIPSNDAVTIKWETAVEKDAAFFQVQRSRDSKNWEVIQTINATNAVNGGNYSYVDASVANTTVYYRLKMVEVSGNTIYSEVSTVRNKQTTATINTYPNPATNYVMVSLNQSAGNGTVSLSNFSGKTIAAKSFNSTDAAVKLDTQSLPNGIYVVEVKDNNNTIASSKVIIRK